MKIRWTPSAADDLKSAHDYIAEYSPGAAGALIDRILGSIEVLARYPEIRILMTSGITQRGQQPFLAKPYSFLELQRRIEKMLSD